MPPLPLEPTLTFLTELLNIHSPTGMTDAALDYCEDAFNELNFPGLTTRRTKKGALILDLLGHSAERPVGLTAHVDTLGLMVKSIKSNGRLKCTNLGGIVWPGVEFEGVTVFPSGGGEPVRGTVVLQNGSVHVNRSIRKAERNEDSLEIRLDARTTSESETRALGINVGDFVCLDPRVERVNGFIRSRFLDDKLSVACIYGALHLLADRGDVPAQQAQIIISNYEEVGHGGASDWRPDLYELLAIDMAAVGDGQASDEFHCTLCVKDASGPYHHGTNQRLRRIAAENAVDLRTDIYPYYSSDGSAYWRGGGTARVGLIGPGVESSHGYERSHEDAVEATVRLIAAYLLDDTFDGASA
jgi:putative aminopeptidase FrvX